MVPLGVGHGRLDEIIHWPEQGQPLYAAMNAGGRCWGGHIEDIDHVWLSFAGCPPSLAPGASSLVPFNDLGVVLNETVPGLSNFSRDGALPPHDPPYAPESYNAAVEWSSSWNPWDGAPVEDTGHWQMSLRTTDGSTARVDVTPRRMQVCTFYAEVPYMWSNYRVSDGSYVEGGVISADTNGVLTVGNACVTPEGNRLRIEGPLPP
jgi:hypothetical protein